MGNDISVRKKLEKALVVAACHATEGRFREAVDALQQVLDEHAGEDPDGWLRSRVRYHQGSFLRISGDPGAALPLLQEVVADTADRQFCLLRAYTIALVLHDLDQPMNALTELESAFDVLSGGEGASDLSTWALYADIAAEQGHVAPARFLPLIRRAIASWGIPPDEDELRDPDKLAEALFAANERLTAFNRGLGPE